MDKRIRAEKVKMIQEVGKAIIDNAESIVGDYDMPQELRIEVNVEAHDCIPEIEVIRKFITKDMIDQYLREGEVSRLVWKEEGHPEGFVPSVY